MVLLPVCFAYNLPTVWYSSHAWNSSRQISGLCFSKANDKNFCGEIICIHNKLIKSQSPHKATHFRGQLLQLRDIFRFFDFLFGGSLRLLVLFSFNRNAAFFTNVSLPESASAMWFKDRPRFHYMITLHLSEIANYFVIITERLYLIQRWSNIAVKLMYEMNMTIVMDTFDWRPPKLSFWNGKKSSKGACDW